MDFTINLETFRDLNKDNIKVDPITFQKMMLVFNSVEQGWSVKKRNGSYVFTKSHEGKKEVLEDTYLLQFMKTHLDINKIFS